MGILDTINKKLDAAEKKYGELSGKAKAEYGKAKAGYDKIEKTGSRFVGYASKAIDLIPGDSPRKKKKPVTAAAQKKPVTKTIRKKPVQKKPAIRTAKPKTKTVLASCGCRAVKKK